MPLTVTVPDETGQVYVGFRCPRWPLPEETPCPPEDAIRRCFLAGQLPEFQRAFLRQAAGEPVDKDVSGVLFRELVVAGAPGRWEWCGAVMSFRDGAVTLQFWVECDGWAVDVSDVDVLIMHARTYRTLGRPRSLWRWDARAAYRAWKRDDIGRAIDALVAEAKAAAGVTGE